MFSICWQVTAASGAMCFINPLYLQEHGDDWLTHSSASTVSLPMNLRREKRLSTTRAWAGRGLKQRSSTLSDDNSSSFDHDRGSGCLLFLSAIFYFYTFSFIFSFSNLLMCLLSFLFIFIFQFKYFYLALIYFNFCFGNFVLKLILFKFFSKAHF